MPPSRNPHVDLSQDIPVEIRDCPNIWNLNLYNYQLTGQNPASLTNASCLHTCLDMEYNHLSGELPSETVGKLSKLSFLHLII